LKHHDKRRQERLAEQLRARWVRRGRAGVQRRHEAQSLDTVAGFAPCAGASARLKSLETDLVKSSASRRGTRRRQPHAGVHAGAETARPPQCRLKAGTAIARVALEGNENPARDAEKTPLVGGLSRAGGTAAADRAAGRRVVGWRQPTDPTKLGGLAQTPPRSRPDIDLER
jgi:hypothetical protein